MKFLKRCVVAFISTIAFPTIIFAKTYTTNNGVNVCDDYCKCYGGQTSGGIGMSGGGSKGSGYMSISGEVDCKCASTTNTCTQSADKQNVCDDYCRCYGGVSSQDKTYSPTSPGNITGSGAYSCFCNSTISTCKDQKFPLLGSASL